MFRSFAAALLHFLTLLPQSVNQQSSMKPFSVYFVISALVHELVSFLFCVYLVHM